IVSGKSFVCQTFQLLIVRQTVFYSVSRQNPFSQIKREVASVRYFEAILQCLWHVFEIFFCLRRSNKRKIFIANFYFFVVLRLDCKKSLSGHTVFWSNIINIVCGDNRCRSLSCKLQQYCHIFFVTLDFWMMSYFQIKMGLAVIRPRNIGSGTKSFFVPIQSFLSLFHISHFERLQYIT